MSGLGAIVVIGMTLPAYAEVAADRELSCSVEAARYELRQVEDEGGEEAVWHLQFLPSPTRASMASDLYLALTTSQRSYWFRFEVSQGYGGISLWPVSDPAASSEPRDLLAGDGSGELIDEVGHNLRFLSLDQYLNIAQDPPNKGEVAPAYILLPELGQGLWYSAPRFTEDPRADRDYLPRGMFRLMACAS